MSFTVAIDGPAAAGKGTISRAVAAHFGFAHLDTGLLYRAVGRRMLHGEEPVAAARTLLAENLEGATLRHPDVAQAAAKVAAIPDVRAALMDVQRTFAARAGGAVLDGRDIGTVICPDAPVKLFVTARDHVRAQRRLDELTAHGASTDFATVLASLCTRDACDAKRATAPMKPARDAVVLDTSDLSIEEAVARAGVLIEKVR
ncbi:MAG: (d)CMP kinase [Rhodobacteraceae bacterium]|nr:(d)CMP kinase [Paracoccaceae bacterium]